MPQRSRSIVQISDPIAALISLLTAYVITWQHSPYYDHSLFTTRRSLEDCCLIALLVFCWHGVFSLAGIYQARLSSFFNIHMAEILRSVLLFPLPVLVCWAITRDSRHSTFGQALTISSLAAAILLVLMVLSRLAFAFFKRYLWYGNNQLRQVLVVGTNQRAMKFVNDALSNPDCGYKCIGLIDDGWFSQVPQNESAIPLVAALNDLPVLLRQKAIDEVVVALPMASFYKRTAEIVSLCQTHGIRVRVIGQLFETHMDQPTLANPDTNLSITVHDPAWSEVSAFVKRSFDVVFSAALLLVTLPILVAVALSISLTSKGPVFFRQTRLGLGKRHFKIFKFRTMVDNASSMMKDLEHMNEMGGPTFKLKNDPRVTRVGTFLRKTSLDELPQLINVLMGDMSMVGPRPLPLRDYEGFSEDSHRRRFSVKPGITCLWQVMGRSTIKFDQWMALDSQYIDQRTFWLDLKILAQTIPAVLRGSGAM
jgi:exopolysaccharide biosynthesis polyprenyl glycosylphosphotransferase